MGGSLEEPEAPDKERGKVLCFLRSGCVGVVKFWSCLRGDLESTTSKHQELRCFLGSPGRVALCVQTSPLLWIGVNYGHMTSPETVMSPNTRAWSPAGQRLDLNVVLIYGLGHSFHTKAMVVRASVLFERLEHSQMEKVRWGGGAPFLQIKQKVKHEHSWAEKHPEIINYLNTKAEVCLVPS